MFYVELSTCHFYFMQMETIRIEKGSAKPSNSKRLSYHELMLFILSDSLQKPLWFKELIQTTRTHLMTCLCLFGLNFEHVIFT